MNLKIGAQIDGRYATHIARHAAGVAPEVLPLIAVDVIVH